jgi:hypothetical protein
MWTDKGCRGIFVVDGAAMECDMTGPGKHFCGDVQCVPWISSLQKEILFNTDIIGINQDVTPQGAPVVLNDLTVWSRKLTGGDVAVALYNQDDTSTSIGFTFDAVGFVGDQGKKTCVRDLWKHVDVSNQIVGNRFIVSVHVRKKVVHKIHSIVFKKLKFRLILNIPRYTFYLLLPDIILF